MQSPLKTVLVFDLETGGLKSAFSSITEFAGVAINLETLEIVDEFSVMILPYLDLSSMEEEPLKEAKAIFRNIASPDPETKIKSMTYNGNIITLKSLEPLAEGIKEFRKGYLKKHGPRIFYDDLLGLEKSKWSDMVEVYFNYCYHPQALEVTHMTREMLAENGVDVKVAFESIKNLIEKHTVGNSKPIIAGHNIKVFDLPFMDKLFKDHKDDFRKRLNKLEIDTIEWARLKWTELPGFSLGVCANEVELTLKEAHRALPDTIANAKFLIRLLKSLRGEGSQKSSYKRRKFNFNF